MAKMITNLGLASLVDTSERAEGFVGLILSNPTKVLTGYTGRAVVRRTFKFPEFCVRTEPAEDGKLMVCGVDTHCAGSSIWDTKVFSEMAYDDGDCNSRLLFVQKGDGGGGAILNVINADVIPSYVRGDPLKVQVVGFPTSIDVFETKEAYDKAWADNPRLDKSLKPAIGAVFPIGIMCRKGMKIREKNGIENIICGRFKGLAKGIFSIEEAGEEHTLTSFLRLKVDTEFGELELAVTRDMLPARIPKDSVIFASVVISADPAIYEYEDGIVRDEENDLRVLRQTIVSGKAERLRPILADNCTYSSEIGKWEKSGISEVIDLYRYISTMGEIDYVPHMATITGWASEDASEGTRAKQSEDQSAKQSEAPRATPHVDTRDNPREDPQYGPGKKALLLENEVHEMESLMIPEYDEEGKISKIKVADARRYKYVIDKRYEKIEMSEDEEELRR